MGELGGRVGWVGAGVDTACTDDTEDEDGIIDAVEGVNEDCVALLQSCCLEAGDELTDEGYGLIGGDGVRRVCCIDV